MTAALYMRVGMMGVCIVAGLWLAEPVHAADDSSAIEVKADTAPTPAKTERSKHSSDGEASAADDSSAHEVTPIEQSSLRGYVPPEPPPSNFTQESRRSQPTIAAVDDTYILVDPEDQYRDSLLSELYQQSFHAGYDYSGRSAPMDSVSRGYDYTGAATMDSFRNTRWTINGEIGFVSGSSTYSDNEAQSWELREKLALASGNSYEFYQRYDVDHSYVSSGEYVLGARQRLKDVLWDGSLDVTEEFTQYRDRNDSNNDRQEGLFKIRFDPQWNEGRTKLELDYKYNIKEYEVFSPRSYKQNSGKLRLTQKFSDRLTGSITGKFDSYDYSLGSTRGNNKTTIATNWDYKASDDLSFSASLESEQKTYSVRKTRDYEQLETRIGARYSPDADSQLSGEVKVTDYVGTFAPTHSYNENAYSFSYQRQLSDELGANIRINERNKRFDLDPSDDLDQHTFNAGLNYNPNETWNFTASFGNDEYAYANPARAYTRRDYMIGAGYTHCDLRLSADYSHSANDYKTLPLQSYDSDTISTSLSYEYERSRLSLAYTLSKLDQADPASFNDYDQTSFNGSWEYEIDPDTDLTLSYDSSNRSYDAQPGVRDTTLEAKLSFEL